MGNTKNTRGYRQMVWGDPKSCWATQKRLGATEEWKWAIEEMQWATYFVEEKYENGSGR